MLIQADARHVPLHDRCVQCVVTSPPYFGLRDYGIAGQIGLEETPEAYVSSLVGVLREVWRVLKDDGVVWLNLGDSYAAGGQNSGSRPEDLTEKQRSNAGCRYERRTAPDGLKPKDLVGIPWRVAFALQADGWYLRSDIIWNKPNPMPESVTDRPTKSHEYLFLLAKQERYYYDAAAIAEPFTDGSLDRFRTPMVGKREPRGKALTSPRQDGNQWNENNGRGFIPHADAVGRNKRSVWTVATQPFSGWTKTSRRVRVAWDESDGDTTRTTSPDCPVHGDRAVQAAKALCGEHGAETLNRTERTDSGLVSSPRLDFAPTDQQHGDCSVDGTTDSLGLSHGPLATARNSRSHRTARVPATSLPCMPCGETTDGTGDTSTEQPLIGEDSRTLVNNTPDRDGQAAAVLAETLGCTVGTCTCEYYRIITEEMSHFATMPEALVEPCILAGSRFGDLVFDPFAGSGTVLAVAERLGRRAAGVDLNPAYHELAKVRTAQRGLRF